MGGDGLMDFEDERYVKLFTRDTPTWEMWPWQAKAIAPNLLRKLDRSGRIEWPPRVPPERAIASVIKFPEAVVRAGLDGMLKSESIELGEGWLVWERFVLGQNSKQRPKTGAERTAGYKRRRKASDDGLVTHGDDASPKVTKTSPIPADPSSAQLSHPTENTRTRVKAAAKGGKTPKVLDLRVSLVLEAIDRERAKHELGPLPPSERHEKPILTRLDEGVPLEDLVLAVELHGRADDGAGRLNATTPFTGPSGRGPGGWSWSRRLLDEHRARAPRRPAMIDDHVLPDWMRTKPEPPKDEPA